MNKLTLISTEQVTYLKVFSRALNTYNNGVCRKETIQVISDLGEAVFSIQYKYHLNYLFRLIWMEIQRSV